MDIEILLTIVSLQNVFVILLIKKLGLNQ